MSRSFRKIILLGNCSRPGYRKFWKRFLVRRTFRSDKSYRGDAEDYLVSRRCRFSGSGGKHPESSVIGSWKDFVRFETWNVARWCFAKYGMTNRPKKPFSELGVNFRGIDPTTGKFQVTLFDMGVSNRRPLRWFRMK